MLYYHIILLLVVVGGVKLPKEGYLRKVTHFGDVFYYRNNSHLQQTILQASVSHLHQQSYTNALNLILDATQNPSKQKQLLQCHKNHKSEYFKFGAMQVGYIGNRSWHEAIILERKEDDCFESVLVNFTNLKKDAINTIEIEIFVGKRKKQFCTEEYVFGTASNVHFLTVSLRKHHKFRWENINERDYDNIIHWGIHIFRFCDSIVHWVPDTLKSLMLFFGGGGGKNPNIPIFGSKVPKYMKKANVDFIEAATGYRWKPRKDVFVNLSASEVQEGDFLAITRFDGFDQLVQYGAGTHAGHSAMVLKVDGILSVVESQTASYWPVDGIQRTQWQKWKKLSLDADEVIALLPLSKQSRAKFNPRNAQKRFKELQGYPYGWHNFFFGWVDTPNSNFPPLLDTNFILVVFSYLQKFIQPSIRTALTEGLNKRLQTQNLKLSQIAIEIAKRNLFFGDLMAIPQQDGWLYSDGLSYVCSSLVAEMYKAGGILPHLQSTQMTPKDVYTLNIFDSNYKVPNKCITNDPTLPYCQIMGDYLMQLPHYATIQPYPNMCQKCPTLSPDFFRPDGC